MAPLPALARYACLDGRLLEPARRHRPGRLTASGRQGVSVSRLATFATWARADGLGIPFSGHDNAGAEAARYRIRRGGVTSRSATPWRREQSRATGAPRLLFLVDASGVISPGAVATASLPREVGSPSARASSACETGHVQLLLAVLGIALVALGALVLQRFPDRPGGEVRLLGLRVNSIGAGLPLIALGVLVSVVAATQQPEDGQPSTDDGSGGGPGQVSGPPPPEDAPACIARFFHTRPSVSLNRQRTLPAAVDDVTVLAPGRAQEKGVWAGADQQRQGRRRSEVGL